MLNPRSTMWIHVSLMFWIFTLRFSKSSSQEEEESEATPLTDDFLLFSDGAAGKIYQMRLDGTHLISLRVKARMPSEIDFDPNLGYIYWSDIEGRLIKRKKLKPGAQEEIVIELTEDSQPEGLVIDPKAMLLFYADAGRGVIYLHSLKKRSTKTLVTDTVKPRSLQIDPTYRYLYWSDWGKQTIERVNYDGSGRIVVTKKPRSKINGIALDLSDRSLYYLDALSSSIEKISLDSVTSDRESTPAPEVTTVFKYSENLLANKTTTNFYALSMDESYVYFTDWYDSAVLRVRKDGEGIQRLGNSTLQTLNGIKAYRSNLYRYGPDTKCAIGNGGCSHICIPITNGVSCACPDDRKLSSDNKTCEEAAKIKGPDLIWLEYDGFFTGYVRGIRGEPSNYLETREVRTWSIRSPAWYWTATDIDYNKNELYLVDKFDKFIVRMTLSVDKQIHVVYYGTSSQVGGIAVDWVNGNLYWTDSLYNWIILAHAEEKTNTTRRLIRTGLDKPHGIAVYPQKGMMYWSDWGLESKIEMATLAGENRKTLVAENLQEPRGISIDYTTDRLFWANRQSIESISLDGTDRRRYGGFSGSSFVDLALHGNYIFATDLGRNRNAPLLWFYDMRSQENGIKLGLQRKPFGVVMSHEDRQPKLESPCKQNRCDQLCVTNPDFSAQCVCQDGYTLMANGRSCAKDEDHVGPTYIYSMGDRVCSVPAKDATTRLLKTPANCFFNNPPKFEFHAMDKNVHSGDVYFSDVKFLVKTIRKADMSNKSENQVVVYGTGNVEGLGVDWLASNLYWTDSSYGQVWVSRLDGSFQMSLFNTKKIPHDIVVDPINKYMYWIEMTLNKSGSVIRRAGLDGSGQIDFITENLGQPTGLAIDYKAQKLYWSDPEMGKIEYANFDRSLRRQQKFFAGSKYRPYSIAVLEDYIAFTDKQPAANSSGLRVIEKESGKEVNDGIIHSGRASMAFGIVAFDKHTQPLVSENMAISCAKENGGCEQICLPSPTGFHCACVNGMKLDGDGRSCVSERILVDDFFLVADDYRHQVYQVGGDLKQVSAVKFPALDRPIGLTYDHQEDKLYWTDFDLGRIRRSNMDGTHVETIKMYRNARGAKSRIDAIVFESEARLLYYADMSENLIAVLNPDGVFRKVIVKGGMTQPRALKLLPENGVMYFGSKGKIERCDMNGENRKSIIDNIGGKKPGWIAGMDIDKRAQLLYWCDHNSESLHVSDLDGGNKKQILALNSLADPFAIALRQGSLYWTDWKLRGLWSATVAGKNLKTAYEDTFTGLNDIVYFTKQLKSGRNACSGDNGGCSHFCIPMPTGRKCACPDSQDGSVDPFDDYNCPGLDTCSDIIPNGVLMEPCHRRYNVSCNWFCNPGYGATSNIPIGCGQDLTWDRDVSTLCSDQTCPLLVTPENAEVDPDCPAVAAIGATCSHHCPPGFAYASGDLERTCGVNRQWTGKPIVCIGPVSSEPTSMMPIFIAIGAALLFIIIIIVLIVYFVIRRKTKKGGIARYRDSNNVMSTQPTTVPQAPLVLNAQAPVYDVASGTVILNRNIAFENPGYATQDEMLAMGNNGTPNNNQAPAMPVKKAISDDEYDDVALKPANEKPGFQNPLYANGRIIREENLYESLPDVNKK